MEKICTGNPAFEFASLFATYVAFSEDDRDNIRKFAGLRLEDGYRIYWETVRTYLGNPDDATFERAERRIEVLGYMRYLTILALEMKDVHTPLKALQMKHAVEHLEAVSQQVEDVRI